MVQHKREHLTTAQLSAYADREMAADELEQCNTHIQTCQECQAVLADLRLTSALLHQMPQVEVPRSFVLPTNMRVLPETPAHRETRRPLAPRRSQPLVTRSLRVLSTLAAIVGLLFILVGVFASLPLRMGTSNTGSTASGNAPQATAPRDTTAPNIGSSALQATQTASAQATHQIVTPKTVSTPATNKTLQPTGAPPLLDPTSPLGHLGIGIVLLIAGILGLLLTRRFALSPPSDRAP